MEELLVEHGVKRSDRLVAINPGAGRPDKRWPIARLIAVAERLATEAGARILLLWGPDEAHLAREIRDGLSVRAMLAPPTDLDELAGLLRRAALVVANDTGPPTGGGTRDSVSRSLTDAILGQWAVRVRCRALQSPDGTMAGPDPGAVFQTALEMPTRGDRRDPPHRHHHRVERGGAAAACLRAACGRSW